MFVYVAQRLAGAVALLFVISVIVFALVRALPGNPAEYMLGFRATPSLVAEVKHDFGLDKPLPEQYWAWLTGALHGDFGYSLATTGTSGRLSGLKVGQAEALGLRVTIPLAVLGTALALAIGIPLGVLAAARRGGFLDALLSNVSLLGISIPDFYLAFLLILLFTVQLGWLPSVGYSDIFHHPVAGLRSLALAILTIGLINSAAIGRMTRAALLESLSSPYILLARARGTFESVVVLKHALRNSLIPVLTVAGLQFGYLLGGVIVIETMFGLPGIGRQLLIAVTQRDYPTIQALLLTFAAAFILVNLLIDLIYPLLDPTLRGRR